jgi:hypothetical protein
MKKLATLILAIASASAVAWVGTMPGWAQAPMGLYGTWTSTMHPGAGGQIKMTDLQVGTDGGMAGRIFFTGSSCALWAVFSGHVEGNSAEFSMNVGPCGVTEVMLQWQGSAWVGTYTSQYPDAGVVQMVP